MSKIERQELTAKVEAALKEAGHGPETHVVFSAFKEWEMQGDKWMVEDNLDEVPIDGAIVVTAPADDYWGHGCSRAYQSKVLTAPTWLELCVAAEEMIHTTNDYHHVFLEAAWIDGTSKGIALARKLGVDHVVRLSMGS